jgi:hypothetical protein
MDIRRLWEEMKHWLQPIPYSPGTTSLNNGFWSGQKVVKNAQNDIPVPLADTNVLPYPMVLTIEVESDLANAGQPTQVGSLFTLEIGHGRFTYFQQIGSRLGTVSRAIPVLNEPAKTKQARISVYASRVRVLCNVLPPFVPQGRICQATITVGTPGYQEIAHRPAIQVVDSEVIEPAAGDVNLLDPDTPGIEHRRAITIFNESSDPLYIRFGLPASLPPGRYRSVIPPMLAYDVPLPIYPGLISGVWNGVGNGTKRALITELRDGGSYSSW